MFSGGYNHGWLASEQKVMGIFRMQAERFTREEGQSGKRESGERAEGHNYRIEGWAQAWGLCHKSIGLAAAVSKGSWILRPLPAEA